MHGVTINPVAFLVIQSNSVKLMPVNHSSSIDKLLDYVPDLIEKTNNMMNRIVSNKKEETEKILKEMQKRNNDTSNKSSLSENKKELNKQRQQVKRNIEEVKNEKVDYEYEYDDTQDD